MRIESNIAGVIAQFDRVTREIPAALDRVLQPENWIDDARDLAETVLLIHAKPNQRVEISKFIDTIMMMPAGFDLRMRSPYSNQSGADRLAATQTLGGLGGGSREAVQAGGTTLFQSLTQSMEAMILEWVETPEEKGGKRRDARDLGKTDEEIARLISYIMLTDDGSRYIVRTGKNQGRLAREVLTPHIAAFIESKLAPALDAKTIDLWLRAVLAAWREMVLSQIGDRIKAELVFARDNLL